MTLIMSIFIVVIGKKEWGKVIFLTIPEDKPLKTSVCVCLRVEEGEETKEGGREIVSVRRIWKIGRQTENMGARTGK